MVAVFKSGAGAALLDVQRFEREWSVALPQDYREFLLEYNGGVLSQAVCRVELIGREVLVEVLLGVGVEVAGRRDLGYWLKAYRDEMPSGFVVIATGSTGLFILGTTAQYPGVYFWDDALAFPESSEDGDNTFQVSSSFAAFLEGLGCNNLIDGRS